MVVQFQKYKVSSVLQSFAVSFCSDCVCSHWVPHHQTALAAACGADETEQRKQNGSTATAAELLYKGKRESDHPHEMQQELSFLTRCLNKGWVSPDTAVPGVVYPLSGTGEFPNSCTWGKERG